MCVCARASVRACKLVHTSMFRIVYMYVIHNLFNNTLMWFMVYFYVIVRCYKFNKISHNNQFPWQLKTTTFYN